MIVLDASVIIAAVVADEPLHMQAQTQLARWHTRAEHFITACVHLTNLTQRTLRR
jgi:predicted nucleic acid-binding protein